MKKFLTLLTIALSLVLINHSCKPEEPGSIYGLVSSSTTLEMLPNVNVRLYKLTEASTATYSQLSSTITSSDGSYEFNDLEPGKYMLELYKNNYYESKWNYLVVEEGRISRMDFTLIPKKYY